MAEPVEPTRSVMGMRIPLSLIPRIIEALRARYPEATAGILDPDRIARRAAYAWMVETLAEHEGGKAMAPLGITVAQTVTEFEGRANAAKAKAVMDAKAITEDPASVPDPEPLPDAPAAAEETTL